MDNQEQIGEIVRFTLPNKEITPAVITRVRNSNATQVDLTLWNNQDGGEFRNGSIHQNVKYSEDPTVVGTFHYRQQARQRQAASA